ncbi:MAG: hypothetical protein K6T66_13340 [Peptococcaceae bacterium]|nr:hypothetical protein [Peptococcaceae bacterium]
MRSGLHRGISFLVLGFILGASLTNVYIGSQLDNLSLANRSLQHELADTRMKMQQLKEVSETRKKHTIDTVEAFLIMDSRDDLTDYDKMAVEFEAGKKVKDWLTPIVGQDVNSLDSLLIPRIVDNREIEANGNKYLLRTYLVVVNQKTAVYVKASRVKQKNIIN